MGMSHKNPTHTTMKTAFLSTQIARTHLRPAPASAVVLPRGVPPRPPGSGRAALREPAPTTRLPLAKMFNVLRQISMSFVFIF